MEDEVLEVEPADIISGLIIEFFCFASVRALQIIIWKVVYNFIATIISEIWINMKFLIKTGRKKRWFSSAKSRNIPVCDIPVYDIPLDDEKWVNDIPLDFFTA